MHQVLKKPQTNRCCDNKVLKKEGITIILQSTDEASTRYSTYDPSVSKQLHFIVSHCVMAPVHYSLYSHILCISSTSWLYHALALSEKNIFNSSMDDLELLVNLLFCGLFSIKYQHNLIRSQPCYKMLKGRFNER